MKLRMRTMGVIAVLLLGACEPPKPKPVPAARLPSVEELSGRYEDDSIIKSTKKTLVLNADGSFTFTTIDQEKVTRSVSGKWAARLIPESGLLELKVAPFFMPDGRTPVASLSMPIETCGGVLCFTHSEIGVFVRTP